MIRDNQINTGKFKILISGFVDNGRFNKRVAKIRKKLGIPPDGFSDSENIKQWHTKSMEETDEILEEIMKLDEKDPNYKDKYNKLYKKAPNFYLASEVQEIINKNPDLSKNFKTTIRQYIILGKNALIGIGSYSVFARQEGNNKIYGMEFYNRLSKKEFAEAVKTMELFNKRLPKIPLSNNIDKDIEILKLSKKKGAKVSSIASGYFGFDEDSKFSDSDIVSQTEIVPLEDDNPKNRSKNKALIRQKRLRINEKLPQLFPKTYKNKA